MYKLHIRTRFIKVFIDSAMYIKSDAKIFFIRYEFVLIQFSQFRNKALFCSACWQPSRIDLFSKMWGNMSFIQIRNWIYKKIDIEKWIDR